MVGGCAQTTQRCGRVKILFASAEFAPLARVGGMAEATSGLVHALRDAGVEVDVVVPDYSHVPLIDEVRTTLDVPRWASPAIARTGIAEDTGPVTLITVPVATASTTRLSAGAGRSTHR